MLHSHKHSWVVFYAFLSSCNTFRVSNFLTNIFFIKKRDFYFFHPWQCISPNNFAIEQNPVLGLLILWGEVLLSNYEMCRWKCVKSKPIFYFCDTTYFLHYLILTSVLQSALKSVIFTWLYGHVSVFCWNIFIITLMVTE
jgi:hypothetical protein